ncbi:hypothetical protein [Bacteroides sp. An19]|nr:hypothetical protein [Bacteroides sp. An19]
MLHCSNGRSVCGKALVQGIPYGNPYLQEQPINPKKIQWKRRRKNLCSLP